MSSVIYKLDSGKISIFYLVSVTVQPGLSLTLLEIQVFSHRGPYLKINTISTLKKCLSGHMSVANHLAEIIHR